MPRRSTGMSVNLENLLVNSDDEQIMAMFIPEDKTASAPSLSDVKQWILEQIKQGRPILPVNPLCGSPCKQAAHCMRFDYTKGCPGYEIEEKLEVLG
jgi:hypothetical protein